MKRFKGFGGKNTHKNNWPEVRDGLLECQGIVTQINKRRLRWLEGVERMSAGRLPQKLLSRKTRRCKNSRALSDLDGWMT